MKRCHREQLLSGISGNIQPVGERLHRRLVCKSQRRRACGADWTPAMERSAGASLPQDEGASSGHSRRRACHEPRVSGLVVRPPPKPARPLGAWLALPKGGLRLAPLIRSVASALPAVALSEAPQCRQGGPVAAIVRTERPQSGHSPSAGVCALGGVPRFQCDIIAAWLRTRYTARLTSTTTIVGIRRARSLSSRTM